MPMPRKYIDEQIENRSRSERDARRETARDMLRSMGHIVFWVLCGLAFLGLALHTDDHAVGMMFWWAGHAVWIGGVAGALLAAYRRGERRGDW
jgi:hypothetical protein